MITNSHGASMVCDLEHCFLYELQHIPVSDNKDEQDIVAVEKYFWETELDKLITDGIHKYHDDKKALLHAAICALEIIIEDLDNRRPRAILLCGGHTDKIKAVKKSFVSLWKDWKDTLKTL